MRYPIETTEYVFHFLLELKYSMVELRLAQLPFLKNNQETTVYMTSLVRVRKSTDCWSSLSDMQIKSRMVRGIVEVIVVA